jgi:hypothetical protein
MSLDFCVAFDFRRGGSKFGTDAVELEMSLLKPEPPPLLLLRLCAALPKLGA